MDVFVARQPIFDRQRRLHGYELLTVPTKPAMNFDGTEAAAATKQVISSTLVLDRPGERPVRQEGIPELRPGFLSDGLYLTLPRQATVIEILESVEPTPDLIALCGRIHEQGYTIALDDFVASPKFEPLAELAQLIKVDMQVT